MRRANSRARLPPSPSARLDETVSGAFGATISGAFERRGTSPMTAGMRAAAKSIIQRGSMRRGSVSRDRSAAPTLSAAELQAMNDVVAAGEDRALLTPSEARNLTELYHCSPPISSVGRLASWFAQLGKYFAEDDLLAFTRGTTFNGRDAMDIPAFLTVLARVKKVHLAACVDDTTAAFLAVSNGKDVVEADHFRDIVTDFKLTIDTERLLAEADTDGSGEIELDEFEVMVKMIDSEGVSLTDEDNEFLGNVRRMSRPVFVGIPGGDAAAEPEDAAVAQPSGQQPTTALSPHREDGSRRFHLPKRGSAFTVEERPAELYGTNAVFRHSSNIGHVPQRQALLPQSQRPSSRVQRSRRLDSAVMMAGARAVPGSNVMLPRALPASVQRQLREQAAASDSRRTSGVGAPAYSATPEPQGPSPVLDFHARCATPGNAEAAAQHREAVRRGRLEVREDPRTRQLTLVNHGSGGMSTLKMPPVAKPKKGPRGLGRVAESCRPAAWAVNYQGCIHR
jgi:hypothetical protein